jgi:hypothetical protein
MDNISVTKNKDSHLSSIKLMKTTNQILPKIISNIDNPEFELLLCCSRTELNSVTVQRIRKLLDDKLDFPKLTHLAGQHRVKPLLYHNLVKYAPEVLGDPCLEELQQQCRRISLRNMFLMKELVSITTMLENEGVQVISFKGPVLADIYGDLCLRQISDLDFLVLEKDFKKATDLLIDQGYEMKIKVPWETHLLSQNRAYSIDLHQDVVPKHLSCFKDSAYLFREIVAHHICGQKVYTFKPEFMLFILCLNGTKEGWCRLSRVCDVAELVRAYPDLDWNNILEMSKSMGSKRMILMGLLLANHLLGVAIPDIVWQESQADSSLRKLFGKVTTDLSSSEEPKEPGEVQRSLFYIKLQERWRDKVRTALGLLDHSGWLKVTDNDREFFRLPTQLSFLYFFLRPFRVYAKYFK